MRSHRVFAITSILSLSLFPGLASAGDAGQIKVAKGSVIVQRGSQQLAATTGMKVQTADVLVTGADGSIGVTFLDNSLVSTGPNSVFAIDSYAFDSTTHVGAFDGSLLKGTLAAVSGKMVKQAPESMRIRTPASIMGVRGTEFVVKVEEPAKSPAGEKSKRQ